MEYTRKPDWLKSNKLGAKTAQSIAKSLREFKLQTVCEHAKCPNQGECFERGTATFMILGNICTRNCAFCAVNKDVENLQAPDKNEPLSIALFSKQMNLKHIVITTVTRDDLSDGGAGQFIETIRQIRKNCDKDVTIEVLISDLQGNWEQLQAIVEEKPDVLNHNIETIERLYPKVRPLADYERSLQLLKKVKTIDAKMLTKSGFMVGLGETKQEVLALMDDLRAVDVDVLTIGQYMQPSKKHLPVVTYEHPETFSYYKEEAIKKGFQLVESNPLVRSSYRAEKARNILKKRR
jgi:lipoic acid synthetase